jgi:endoglucanase
MQSCLKTGAYCVIDVHNFARWNGEIVGHGGPTDAQFADLWTQLATKYADNPFVILGLTNEPHDLDVPTWVVSAQTAVTAILKAETVSHIILLPGTNFTSAGTFVTASTGGAGWGPALAAVVNPDKSTTDLIFDLHKYLDIDNSGNHVDCVTDNIATAFAPVATWLRTNQRQALLSETGAGASTSVSISFPNLTQLTDSFSSASPTSARKTSSSTLTRTSISATSHGEQAA